MPGRCYHCHADEPSHRCHCCGEDCCEQCVRERRETDQEAEE